MMKDLTMSDTYLPGNMRQRIQDLSVAYNRNTRNRK